MIVMHSRIFGICTIVSLMLSPVAARCSNPAPGGSPTQNEQIHIAAFDFYLKEFVDNAPQYLTLDDGHQSRDLSLQELRSIRRFFPAATSASEMDHDYRKLVKNEKSPPNPIIRPGVIIELVRMLRTGPGHVDVTINSKVNPMGDSDYGSGEEVVLHVVRHAGQWAVKSKTVVSAAG